MGVTIYANSTPLSKVPVTQNERGWYYSNGSSYFKPLLKDFDNATLPKGYKKYTSGSHSDNYARGDYDIDFSLVAGTKLTCSDKLVVEYRLTTGNTYMRCHLESNPNIKFYFWHVYKMNLNKVINPGEVICEVKPMDTGSHLHFRAKGVYTRDLILGTFSMNSFKKGDRVIFTGEMNLRRGHGLNEPVTKLIKPGAVGVVYDGPRTANGYTWWDIHFNDTSGWVADTGRIEKTTKAKTDSQPTVDVKPTPSELEQALAKIAILEKSLKDTVEENDNLRNESEDLKQEIISLKIDLQAANEFKTAVAKVVKIVGSMLD